MTNIHQEDTSIRKGAVNDHLANERTFLAWIRTSIAMMGFGFVVVKFSLFIRQLSLALAEKAPVVKNRGYSSSIGIALVVVGALIALLAYFRYRHIERQLSQGHYFPSFSLSLITTITILLVSTLLVIYLMTSF